MSGCVYIMADAAGNHKIGYSSAPKWRLAQVQTDVPSEFRPVVLRRVSKFRNELQARWVEKAAREAVAVNYLGSHTSEWRQATFEECQRALLRARRRLAEAERLWRSGTRPKGFRRAEELFAPGVEIIDTRKKLQEYEARAKLPKGFSTARAYDLFGKRDPD